MSSLPVCEHYIVNGQKYHAQFPIEWARNHLTFPVEDMPCGTGPIECLNCEKFMCLNDVFIGYCANCIGLYHDNNCARGVPIEFGCSIAGYSNEAISYCFPYMAGFDKKLFTTHEDYIKYEDGRIIASDIYYNIEEEDYSEYYDEDCEDYDEDCEDYDEDCDEEYDWGEPL
jgi:hypothetical protein